MIMFSIIQLGFTRFLTDRKEWIYLPPLRYMCVWCVVGVPDIGGSTSGFWLPFWILSRKKMQRAPSVYAHRLGGAASLPRLGANVGATIRANADLSRQSGTF